MSKICIIGGSGFIGSSFAKILSTKSKKFYILDKSSSKTFSNLTKLVDIRDIKKLNDSIENDSIIINLAAEHRDDVTPKSLYYDVNVSGALNICNVARNKKISTIIFTSSVAVYGFNKVPTNESGELKPFNDYGLSKLQAESIFKQWYFENPNARTLVIIRPTVVFGEGNRGNVYNLLRFISSGNFVMVGNGSNTKSMAYVENLAAFINYSLGLQTGIHIFNYVDKPDLTIKSLIDMIVNLFPKRKAKYIKIPYFVGYSIGLFFDLISNLTGKKFKISSIRIKKFCSNSVYETSIDNTSFSRPYSLDEALRRTINFEFINNINSK